MKKILHFLLEKSDYIIADDYEQADYCKTLPKSNITTSLIAVACIVSILLLCVFLSTVYDLQTMTTEVSKKNQWFLAFSIYRNASILFDCSTKSADVVKSFHFFRSTSAFLIVFAHVAGTTIWFPMSNRFNVEEAFYTKMVQLSGCFLHMFLVISGFLASKSVIKKMQK